MQSKGAYLALSVVTGLLMIVLGGLFLARPGLSLASVILLIGTFSIAYGVFLAVSGIAGRQESRGWAIAVGVLAVIMGIVVLAWPAATSLAVLYIIAFWALITGVADLAAALMKGHTGGQRLWLAIVGLLGVVIGIVFLVNPGSGILALLWLAGIYLVVLGVLRIMAGFTNPPRPAAA